MTYQYTSADGITRNRCPQHIRRSGPYRAITPPRPSTVKVCVECNPWGGIK